MKASKILFRVKELKRLNGHLRVVVWYRFCRTMGEKVSSSPKPRSLAQMMSDGEIIMEGNANSTFHICALY